MREPKFRLRFNIVDIVIILAVLVAAAGIAYKSVQAGAEIILPPENINVTLSVIVRGTTAEIAESFVKELPADCLWATSIVSGSKVVSAEIVPSEFVASTAEGVPVTSIDPSRFDLLITVEGVCPKDDAVYTIGGQEVRIGRSYMVKTEMTEMVGTIADITINT